jgi:ABC-type transport system involved in cytochrome bd biosynthesis fused ATPase/permease subunit
VNGPSFSEIPAVLHRQFGYLPQIRSCFQVTIRENTHLAWMYSVEVELHRLLPFPSGTGPKDFPGRHRHSDRRARYASFGWSAPTGGPGALLGPTLYAAWITRPDDPFSAVDLDTEALLIVSLRQAFGQVHRKASVLPTAFFTPSGRISTGDCIIVIDQGCILESGTHAELMAAVLYARIFKAQRWFHGTAGMEGAHA